MNMLFTRSQMRSSFFTIVPLRIGGTVTFKLKAELELTEEEKLLLKKYSFGNAVLVASDVYEDLQRSFRPALLLGIIAALLAALFIPTSSLNSPGGLNSILIKATAIPLIGISTLIILTIIYFYELRKSITVSQLLNGGRTFLCNSVVELDEQEIELLDLSRRLHATLEKARDWGGREINPIPTGDPFYLPSDQHTHHRSTIEQGLYNVGEGLKNYAKKIKGNVQQASNPANPKVPSPFLRNNDAAAKSPEPAPQAPQSNTSPTNPTAPPTQPSPPTAPQQPNQAQSNPTHPFSPKPPKGPDDVGGGEFG